MKHSPIIFSAPMVRAIINGQKTQTRRLVKGFALEMCRPYMFTPKYVAMPENMMCQYGYAGDTLWVRETFGQLQDEDGGGYVYKANTHIEGEDDWIDQPWKPSIHMPRAASRITLKINELRVERLQDISESDAIAEGVFYSDSMDGYCTDHDGRNFHASDPRISFCKLWCSIHSPESWDANPWVWVIGFEKI